MSRPCAATWSATIWSMPLTGSVQRAATSRPQAARGAPRAPQGCGVDRRCRHDRGPGSDRRSSSRPTSPRTSRTTRRRSTAARRWSRCAPEDLVGEIEVSDADLRAAYDARIDQYRTPEQREDRAAARSRRGDDQACGRSGRSRTELQRGRRGDAGDRVERSELGPLAKGDLPEAWTASLCAPTGAVSAPVQTPFGWHLLRPRADRAGAGPAVRGGRGRAAPRAEPRARDQPAARHLDAPGRRACRRHPA